MPTLEQRVAALESGELERLRGLAARRLERLRQERAAVADLRERLDAANEEIARLQNERRNHADVLAPLRAAIGATAGASSEYVVLDAVERIRKLRERLDWLQDACDDQDTKLAAANTTIAKLACR